MSKLAKALQAAAGNAGGAATEGNVYAIGYATQGRIGNNLSGNDAYGTTIPYMETTFRNVSSIADIPWSSSVNYAFISDSGYIYNAGENAYGQLGNNTVEVPVLQTVTPASRFDQTFTQMALGQKCQGAIKSDGTLWTWGLANAGQLGNNISSSFSSVSSPTQIGSDTNWSSIKFGGSYFAIARKTDGTLWSWGSNGQGYLGQNNTISRSSPVQIGSDTNWASYSAGDTSTCAIKTDGTLWSWGFNGDGQLGINNILPRSSPVQVGSLTNWSKVIVSGSWALALKTDGTIWSWGENTFGQLGIGSTVKKSSPVQVGSDTDWSDIYVSLYSAYAKKPNGDVYVWGLNTNRELAYTGDSRRSTPTQIAALSNLSGVAQCYYALGKYPATTRTLFLINNKLYTIRGTNDSTTNNFWPWAYPTPINDTTDPTFAKVAASQNTLLMLKSNGELWAVGNNGNGQLGQGDTISRSSPVQIGALTDWQKIAAGGDDAVSPSCYAIKTDMSLWGWGGNANGQIGKNNRNDYSSPVQISGLGDSVAYVSTRGSSMYYTESNGKLWAVGLNDYGQLGINNRINRSLPAQVGTLTDWGEPSAGYSFAGCVKTDGTLWMWGQANSYGQLGGGNRTNRSSPVQVGTLTDWASVSCGFNHTVAIKTDGTLWAWGSNLNGCLGNGGSTPRSSPVQIGSDTTWVKAKAGHNYTYAVKSDGTLWGWGTDAYICEPIASSYTWHKNSPIQIGYYNMDPTKSISNVVDIAAADNGPFIIGSPAE